MMQASSGDHFEQHSEGEGSDYHTANNGINVQQSYGNPGQALSNVGGSSVGSTISTNTDSNLSKNVVSLFRDQFIGFMISFNAKISRISNLKYGILNILIYIYLLYVTIVLSSCPSRMDEESTSAASSPRTTTTTSTHHYLWGEIPGWVHRALFYPVNLAVEHYPYELTLTISVIYLLLEVICIGLLVLFQVAKNKGSKWSEKLNSIASKIIIFLIVTSHYALWIHTVPMAAELSTPIGHGTISTVSSSEEGANLFYYPTITLGSTLNVIFIVIGGIGVVLNVCITLLGFVLTAETVPPMKKFSFFSVDKLEPTAFMIFTNQISVIVTVILTPHLAFVSSSLKILMSAACLFFFISKIPYYRKWENSLMVGILFGKTLGSIGPLVSDLIVSEQSNSTFGGIMTGVAIGLQVSAFLVGFIGFFIYLSFITRSVRKFMLNEFEDKKRDKVGAQQVFSFFDENKNMKKLVLFLKLSMGEKDSSNFEVATRFVRNIGVSRSMTNVDFLVTTAIFSAFYPDLDDHFTCIANSIHMLQRAQKQHPSISFKYMIMLRHKEIEENMNTISAINIELRQMLQALDKKQHLLQYFHREFYKELLNEHPSLLKMENINRTIAIIIQDCDLKFRNLLISHPNDKILLRSYACYMETCRWEKEIAAEFYDDANQIEEEEARKSHHYPKKAKNLILSSDFSKRRIVPNSNRIIPISSNFDRKENNASLDFEAIERSFDQKHDEENWESVSNAEELSKKEDLFRIAINTEDDHTFTKIWFVLFTIFSVIVISVIVGFAMEQLKETTDRVSLQEKVCSLSGIPYLLISQLRSVQSIYRFSSSEEHIAHVPLVARLAKNQLHMLIEKVQHVKDASNNGEFLPEVVKMYNEIRWINIIPIKQKTDELSIPNSHKVNGSIAEFVESILTHSTELEAQFDDMHQLNYSMANYNFLYYYLGRVEMTEAFNHFCSAFIESSESFEIEGQKEFYILCGVFMGSYVLFSLLYVIVLRTQLLQTLRIIRCIFKKIPKEESGKVFHRFDKKIYDEIHKENRTLLTPKNLFLITTILIILVTLLVCALVIVDFQIGSQKVMSTMLTVSSLNDVIAVSSKVTFTLNELIVKSLIMEEKWEDLRDSNLEELKFGALAWRAITVGGTQNDYKPTIYGVLPEIDDLLDGTCVNKSFSISAPINYTSVMSELSCRGMDQLVNIFLDRAHEFSQDFYHNYYDKETATDLYFSNIYFISIEFADKLLKVISVYVNYSKHPEFVLAAVATSIGLMLIFVLSYFAYSNLSSYWREKQTLRSLLNYVSWELIEQIDDLKQYAVSHRIKENTYQSLERVSSKFAKYNVFKFGGDDEEDSIDVMSMTKSILTAAADGSIVCNSNGSITIFNPAAEDMFGLKVSEVMGTHISDLFSSGDQQKIGNLVKSMNNSISAFSETFEATAIRRNKTTFSVKLSMSVCIFMKKAIISCFVKDITPEKKQNALIAEEKKKSEDLLLNILPLPVATRLKQGETFIAEKFTDVTVFFSDMVGFTKMSSGMEPDQLVKMLNTIVNEFDKLTEKYSIDKIKTIGDAYFSVGGLHASKSSDHPERMLRFSIDIFFFLNKFNAETNNKINLRIGLHTGPCVGGVIGTKKFAYDLWGDTINTASRMESTGVPGRIQISRSTYERVFDLDFQFEEREGIEVKGKGLMKTYLVHNKHHPAAFEEIETTLIVEHLSDQSKLSVTPKLEHLESTESLESNVVRH